MDSLDEVNLCGPVLPEELFTRPMKGSSLNVTEDLCNSVLEHKIGLVGVVVGLCVLCTPQNVILQIQIPSQGKQTSAG